MSQPANMDNNPKPQVPAGLWLGLCACLMWPGHAFADDLAQALDFCINPNLDEPQVAHDTLLTLGWHLGDSTSDTAYGAILRETWAIEDYFSSDGQDVLGDKIMTPEEARETAEFILQDSLYDPTAETQFRIYLRQDDPHLGFKSFAQSKAPATWHCAFGVSGPSVTNSALMQLVTLSKLSGAINAKYKMNVLSREEHPDRITVNLGFASSFGAERPAEGALKIALLRPKIADAAVPPFGTIGLVEIDVHELRKRN